MKTLKISPAPAKSHSTWLLLLSLSFFLLCTACTSNPFGNRDTSRSAIGVTAGGAAGALGTAALGAPRPLIVSAGLGGMALGYYMTTIRFDAGPIYKAGGEVYTQGEYAGISIPAYKLFDSNTAELLPQAGPLLDSAVAVLKRYPDSNILVSGNSSGFGLHRAEQKLSQARARQVAAYLWAHGVNNYKHQSLAMRKLAFVGYGSRSPIVNEPNGHSMQKNSRIQITAYPSKEDLQLDKTTATFVNVGSSSDDDLRNL